jgi:hypothetical protein
VRRCWYEPDLALRAEIIAGWKQFDADLAAYVPPAAAGPALVAAPVQALPAVTVQVAGEIAIKDNFRAFETALRDFLEHRLIREPKTDQQFADLEVQIKAMKGAEAALESAEAQMLAQIEPVSTAKATKDLLHKLVRDNRLMAEKLLASEKERRRGEIVAGGITALREHVAALTQRLGKPYLPAIPADFAGAIKGKKSLASMEDAVGVELSRAKIEANRITDLIDTNLKALRELASEHAFLFADTATLVLKAPDDCRAVITSRITEHKTAEAARLEAEREKIRKEEAERLEREQKEREAAAARKQEDEARQLQQEQQNLREVGVEPSAPAPAPVAAPSTVVPMQRPVATSAPAANPTLRLGQINERLHPLQIDAAGLASLGFPHSATEKAAKLYHEHQFPAICAALLSHISSVRDQRQTA